MKYLYIFLEGEDDKRYFKAIIEPVLKNKYDKISYHLYRQEKKEKVIRFLKSIESVSSWDYIFIADIDLFEDVKSKKEKLIKSYENLKADKIVIVIREIESWYLAGLDLDYRKKYDISIKNNTNDIIKESFDNILKKSKLKRMSKSSWMIEIIKNYNLDIATHNNDSLNYFIKLIS